MEADHKCVLDFFACFLTLVSTPVIYRKYATFREKRGMLL